MKIAFIAPFKKIGDLFTEVCNELGKSIPIYIGDLEKGAQKAVELEEDGIDVVISRGGTAIAVNREVTSIPVVEVQVSGFDLIRVLHEARQHTDKIVIAGFDPFTYGIEGLGNIMDIDLRVLKLNDELYDQPGNIEKKLEQIKKKDFHWLVGDNISVKIAKQIGMDALLIRSGKEALVQAILEAERVARVRREEKEKTKRFKSIVDFAYEGIISIDQKGIIKTFNPKAEKIFEEKSYKVIGKKIKEVLPEMDLIKYINQGQREQGKILSVKNKKIATNIIPIIINEEVVGTVATFQKVSKIQKVEKKIRNELYLKGYTAENTFGDIIGNSNIMTKVKEEASDYAQANLPLLIYGETGTGKELFAQAIHNASPRRNKPFLAFNCAALPEKLLESELFGYVKGAFTGARDKGKAGLFEQAHEGTIFLDEIGEISQDIQARLLRVFQERKIRRLGDNKLTPVDVRIMLATNKSLAKLVKENKFRDDLYYRISVLNLKLPPLRERKGDIPLLVNFFIKKARSKLNKVVKGISDKGMKILQSYNWPGNVRQLENIIEKLVVRTKDDYIMTGLVKETISSIEVSDDKLLSGDLFTDKIEISLDNSLEEIEKEVIIKMIEKENGNKAAAARKLGIGRSTVWRKIKK